MNDDGTMARVPDLLRFAATHDLPVFTIADLIRYRLAHETLVAPRRLAASAYALGRAARSRLSLGSRRAKSTSRWCSASRAARTPVLVRVHSQCLTGDVFGSHALRLRAAARARASSRIARGRPRGAALPPAGRPRHRTAQQAQGLRAAGCRARHGRGQRAPRLPSPISATTASGRRSCAISASRACA